MSRETCKQDTMLGHQPQALEGEMVGVERWTEVRRLHHQEGHSITATSRQMGLVMDASSENSKGYPIGPLGLVHAGGSGRECGFDAGEAVCRRK